MTCNMKKLMLPDFFQRSQMPIEHPFYRNYFRDCYVSGGEPDSVYLGRPWLGGRVDGCGIMCIFPFNFLRKMCKICVYFLEKCVMLLLFTGKDSILYEEKRNAGPDKLEK